MSKATDKRDTERLEFLVADGGQLATNGGKDYIYWYPECRGRTLVVEGRTFRDALDAAMRGEMA